MRAERRLRRSKRCPEALASRRQAILGLDHRGPTDKLVERPSKSIIAPDPFGTPCQLSQGKSHELVLVLVIGDHLTDSLCSVSNAA